MRLPEGYVKFIKETRGVIIDPNQYCLKLLKAIYGLIQAARQWWKKFKAAMAKLHYYPSLADPCLFTRQATSTKSPSFVIIYVDDGGIFGSQQDIDEIIKGLSKEFVIMSLGPMKDFVGCQIIESDAKDTIWIHQPKLLKNLKKEFQHLLPNRKYTTPAAPKTIIMRPKEGDPTIDPFDQKKFRTGVGMLLYLVKHSRPDISNAVRELSKVADGATQAHWNALLRTIKYVIDTENFCLKMTPLLDKNGFYLKGISDSEYAGDKDTRISVYGYILYFCGAPISWKSKSGKSVTLSSTEAE
jgi:hypothetical protein